MLGRHLPVGRHPAEIEEWFGVAPVNGILDLRVELAARVDFMLQVVASDLDSLGSFLEGELLKLPAVKDASTSIVLNEVKPRRTMVTGGW